ncbi:TPA: hypothetical protein HA251_06785 [Candidatus Woesearchaeota archaeon]|nr:hypothetical protein [Candidatus Woesearchaeota archaeon]
MVVDDSTIHRRYGTIGVVGRFKPLHHGGAAMLDGACERAEHVVIAIGSANRYDLRNPFTPDETRGMLDAYLSPRYRNYTIRTIDDYGHIPEFHDGQRWREEAKRAYHDCDAIVTGNPYVARLLADDFPIMQSSEFVEQNRRVFLSSTMVRQSMARGGNDWKRFVPDEVADYIETRGLARRFRQEFGLVTLASIPSYDGPEGYDEEVKHVQAR